MDPLLITLGLLVGSLVGLTGVGGGAVLTPLLILVIGVRPITAIGTDLAFAAITKSVGAYQHKRHDSSDPRLVFRLAIGSVPGAILGAWLMSLLESAHIIDVDVVLTRLLGIVLVVSAVLNLLRLFNIPMFQKTKQEPGLLATAGIGLGIGIMVGCTSIGAGSLLMAMLAIFFKRLPIAQAVGVDVMHGAILAVVAAMAHGMAGNIELPMVANLLTGSIPGVLMGSWLCSRMPSRPLRFGIATMLVISGVHLLV